MLSQSVPRQMSVQRMRIGWSCPLLDIENKLVPKGPDVTRHLTLPPTGLSAEDVFAEMDKLDKEGLSHTDWSKGKISGAVYRACSPLIISHCT